MLNDSIYRPHTEIINFEIADGQIRAAICRNNRTQATLRIQAKQYVNAGGAWAMDIAKKAGCTDVNLLYSKGTLLVSHDRMTGHVIN